MFSLASSRVSAIWKSTAEQDRSCATFGLSAAYQGWDYQCCETHAWVGGHFKALHSRQSPVKGGRPVLSGCVGGSAPSNSVCLQESLAAAYVSVRVQHSIDPGVPDGLHPSLQGTDWAATLSALCYGSGWCHSKAG